MKVIKYTTEIEDGKNILVKESSSYCPEFNALDSPQKVADFMNFVYNANKKAEEYMWLLALDTKSHLIGLFELSHGTVNSSLVSPREIFVRLCLCGASTFVLVHNHPSGDCTPSNVDIATTRKIDDAAKIMGIALSDHIVIGNKYYSFREFGLL